MVFEPEDLLFCAAGPPALLPSYPFAFLLLCAFLAEQHIFYFIREDAACKETIECLGTFPLAFDLYSCRNVFQVHAGRHLVHVLPAMTARADETLGYIFFVYPQVGKPLAESFFLLGTYRKSQRFRHCLIPIPFTYHSYHISASSAMKSKSAGSSGTIPQPKSNIRVLVQNTVIPASALGSLPNTVIPVLDTGIQGFASFLYSLLLMLEKPRVHAGLK